MVYMNLREYMSWHGIAQEEHFPAEAWENSIMQSTGLTDKNGKEIFEGDIVLWNGIQCHCVFENTGFGLRRSDRYASHSWGNFTRFIEIIGNIYGSPDLLPAN